jgi:hypothetical protein
MHKVLCHSYKEGDLIWIVWYMLFSPILKPYPVLFNRFVKGLMARQNHNSYFRYKCAVRALFRYEAEF